MTSKTPKKKTILEQELEEALAKNLTFVAEQLRRQIAAEKAGLSSQELYLGRPCILSKNDRRS